ncbi:MAG TPA: LLM class flavin-dependent oxidoreductase, partial [Streptosporangiaceae bacterium]|nr:LLM class flavin-dependent oxidoreductase [Streptosporangiaceae bacterium]
IGTGWSRVEYRALGVEHLYEPRGRATNEALDVMLTCWRGGEVDHDGEFYSFRHVTLDPTPTQLPHPPLWVGGHSEPALRRAARLADIWHPHDLSPADLAATGARLDEMAGREVPRSVRLHVTEDDVPGLADTVDAYLAVGCVRIVLDFRSQPCDVVTRLGEKAAALLFS